MNKDIIIFTDGASKGNPGPGGYGVVLVLPEGRVVELGGYEAETTNNRMELSGAIKALENIQDREEKIAIYTDSKYLIGGMTEWVFNWQKNNWRTAQKKPVLNKDLWEKLVELVKPASAKGFSEARKISWHYVAGHAGHPANERCDEIASGLALKENIDLYDGPLVKYTVKITLPC